MWNCLHPAYSMPTYPFEIHPAGKNQDAHLSTLSSPV
jgi:hypothetical protein